MQTHEYIVIPAPNRGEKTRGARTGAERFSQALTTEINRMAAGGWDYVRAETLPCEERTGLTSRTTVYHNVLVFRRARAVQPAPAPLPEPHPAAAPVDRAAAALPVGEAPGARAPLHRLLVATHDPVPSARPIMPPPVPAGAAAAPLDEPVAAADEGGAETWDRPVPDRAVADTDQLDDPGTESDPAPDAPAAPRGIFSTIMPTADRTNPRRGGDRR